jgi:hypothetical protein
MQKIKYIFTYFCAVLVATFCISAQAELSGKEIMMKVEEQSRLHKNQKFNVFMRIVDSKNRERTRYFTSWKKHQKNTYSLARFYKPVNLKNTGLLSVLEKGEDISEQWIYLPAFRSVKKLSSNDKNKSFMGTDFSNSDIGGRNIDADIHKLVSQDKKYYVVESYPKSKQDNYARIVYKVHKKVLVPVTVKFYGHDGKLIKRLKNKKIIKHRGMYIAVSSVVHNPNTDSTTYVKINKLETDIVKDISFFSTRGLKL